MGGMETLSMTISGATVTAPSAEGYGLLRVSPAGFLTNLSLALGGVYRSVPFFGDVEPGATLTSDSSYVTLTPTLGLLAKGPLSSSFGWMARLWLSYYPITLDSPNGKDIENVLTPSFLAGLTWDISPKFAFTSSLHYVSQRFMTAAQVGNAESTSSSSFATSSDQNITTVTTMRLALGIDWTLR
jgi:hypothetical protein